MIRPKENPATSNRAEFYDALQKGVLLGAAVLLLILPPLARGPSSPQPSAPAIVRANFGDQQPSPDARSVANWVVHSGDHKNMSFVIVDKKEAKVYVFNPRGQLKEVSVALLGSAVGDDTVPGIGDKPLSQVLPEEKTTPAGRFIAELGMNTKGEDIVWVDYDAAVSMHRVRANVKAEQRLERLASPTPEDNRISFGCINLPVAFYENTLKPTVQAGGTVIYVLPETRSPGETFASYYDVDTRLKLAQR
jgi:hypothetical protein